MDVEDSKNSLYRTGFATNRLSVHSTPSPSVPFILVPELSRALSRPIFESLCISGFEDDRRLWSLYWKVPEERRKRKKETESIAELFHDFPKGLPR